MKLASKMTENGLKNNDHTWIQTNVRQAVGLQETWIRTNVRQAVG